MIPLGTRERRTISDVFLNNSAYTERPSSYLISSRRKSQCIVKIGGKQRHAEMAIAKTYFRK
jgi:hypothetical protein